MSAQPKTEMAEKLVYSFAGGAAEGKGTMRELLGGKGANLAEMCALGLPVPPGFTITTEVCVDYYKNGKQVNPALEAQVKAALAMVEKHVGATFGDSKNPLLLSVRSGARASMPGMMDTVLNLGLNDATVKALAEKTANPRFAYDSYRRFIQMYSDVVLGIDHYHFEEMLEQKKMDRDITLDTELTESDLKELVSGYKEKVAEELGRPFPDDVHEQLWGAIRAVFDSWMSARAKKYRELHDIPESWGTAVTVQSMVFGNMGDDCATGVAFTRNPSTGERAYYGEFLINAQGEDVVAGIRTPQPLSEMPAVMPQVYKQLTDVFDKLETHYRDMQDIEFTIQNHKLWMLQTRNGKRTAAAAVKIAVDMVGEKRISKEEALKRIDPLSLDQLLHPTLDPKATKTVLAKGLPASPGAASGKVVFSAEDAEEMALRHKEKVILVRIETSPEDIHGMHAAQGILTARGGMTSHAAVVARGMGKPCVSGAGDVRIDYAKKEFQVMGRTVKEGEMVTINGSTGEVMLGEIPTVQPSLSGDFETLMGWADSVRKLRVRTNAETPLDAKTARSFGAEGIGLCRTEHMFFDAERIIAMREMIVAKDTEGRKAALAKLLPMQRKDFTDLFTIMKGLPVTIRLLDPPLHEFLPHTEEDMKQVAKAAGISVENVRMRAHELKEQNPMLGHRGCRLGITYPEIYAMQARAIFEAAASLIPPPASGGRSGGGQQESPPPQPSPASGRGSLIEIMIPLVMMPRELEMMKQLVDDVAASVMKETGKKIDYLVGTMIELPRAALMAGEIAKSAEFFSFGTNDLTQTTLGISRDDSASFIEIYKQKGIVEQDPFVTLDQSGVGELINIAAERGRATRSGIKMGICGEHGGDPASIAFCQKAGLDYVSCSPYRVPVARLAAAQAAL
ncbi:MAG: pyruvate, phosphate dikinase [Alphaproteobacteria bacterium]|nr:pyruvate, phosphate dikinase [Alphaproteobacteria bacterium]